VRASASSASRVARSARAAAAQVVWARIAARQDKQRHRRQTADISADAKIAVENFVGAVPVSAKFEIHQQEGNIVQHVDDRDIIVELDVVEQHRLATDQADFARVEIAVTAPDPTIGFASHRDDAQIEIRRAAPVKSDFRRAAFAAPRQGCVVEIVEMNRALHLVGPVAGWKHHRDMRLDPPHRPHIAAMVRIAQADCSRRS